MSYSPIKHISKERQLRADTVRHNAWADAQELIGKGQVKNAYQRMREGCKKAWRIESLQDY